MKGKQRTTIQILGPLLIAVLLLTILDIVGCGAGIGSGCGGASPPSLGGPISYSPTPFTPTGIIEVVNALPDTPNLRVIISRSDGAKEEDHVPYGRLFSTDALVGATTILLQSSDGKTLASQSINLSQNGRVLLAVYGSASQPSTLFEPDLHGYLSATGNRIRLVNLFRGPSSIDVYFKLLNSTALAKRIAVGVGFGNDSLTAVVDGPGGFVGSGTMQIREGGSANGIAETNAVLLAGNTYLLAGEGSSLQVIDLGSAIL